MFKKLLICALVVSCSAAVFAQNYATEWKAAYKLYRAKKYAEAITAFEKLAESTSNPSNKHNCYIHAGYSARSLKKYDEAIAFAKKSGEVENPYKYVSLIRQIDFMYSARKYKEALAMFSIDDIMQWPKCYRSDALYYLGLAQYNLKKGEDAEKTFKLMHENAVTVNHKSLSLIRHGYNYRHRLKNTDKAIESFREATEVPNAHPNHKSESYIGIADIFISQKKYDEALAEYDKLITIKKVSAYWKSRGLYNKGNLLKRIGKKEEAIKCYNQAIATKGCAGWVKKGCQKQLKALQPKE